MIATIYFPLPFDIMWILKFIQTEPLRFFQNVIIFYFPLNISTC